MHLSGFVSVLMQYAGLPLLPLGEGWIAPRNDSLFFVMTETFQNLTLRGTKQSPESRT